MSLQIDQVKHPKYAFMAFDGEIDLYSASIFYQSVERLLDAGNKRLVLDFSKVAYLDSSGVGALIRIAHKARIGRVRFVLYGVGGSAMKVLRLTQISPMFTLLHKPEDLVHFGFDPDLTKH